MLIVAQNLESQKMITLDVEVLSVFRYTRVFKMADNINKNMKIAHKNTNVSIFSTKIP